MFGEDEGVKLYERKKGKQQKESQDYTVFKTNGVGFTWKKLDNFFSLRKC